MQSKLLAMLSAALLGAAFVPAARAQFSASSQIITIIGMTNNWVGTYFVGRSNTTTHVLFDHDTLQVELGGVLSNSATAVGVLSSNNNVIVSGNGSVVESAGAFNVGYSGAENTLVLSAGGTITDVTGSVGGTFTGDNDNTALVTDPGTLWINNPFFANPGQFMVGGVGSGNNLVISNSAMIVDDIGYMGSGSPDSNNRVLVTDNAVWVNHQTLYVAYFGQDDVLTIAGGSVLASNVFICYTDVASNDAIHVTSGSLIVTNAQLLGLLNVGHAGGKAELTIDGGSVTVDGLVATNGINSALAFNSGTVDSKGTTVANTREFFVGNGTNAALYHLSGGAHAFNNGLHIANAATLSGCGTINGTVTVDAGGTILADCGGVLNFANGVVNNGTMSAINGSVLEASGPVVNNGILDLINGGGTNFSGGFINNGTVLDARSVMISQAGITGTDFVVQIASLANHTYQVQVTSTLTPPVWTGLGASQSGNGNVLTFTDPGATTNASARFYRVDVTAP
jgi:fibronectin-binding autotransporter adhesin